MADFVFFGSPSDPHIQRVSTTLAGRGARIACLASLSDEEDGASWPCWSSATLPGDDRAQLGQLYGRREFSPRTIWWMRNKVRVFEIQSEEDQRREFEIATRQELAESLAATFGGRRINPSYRQTLNKIGQLSTAARVGMKIPRTIVTSQRATVLEFLEEVGPAIAKPLGISYVSGVNGNPATAVSVMTNEITREEVCGASDLEFASAPIIIQERVAKQYEMRVIAFGESVLAYKIDSQARALTALDWRRGEPIPGLFEAAPTLLTEGIARAVRAFLLQSGLDTGVFDFAVDHAGQWIFFECNPNGQWAALEGDDREISTMFAIEMERMAQAAWSPIRPSAQEG